ncbi:MULTISPECIES: hypothetical protein [unclassified Paraburkholderia]|uniref:hypothetical protein n=1 Tax=unclassified Paraburkholderia TaxID=2615204 RepID=UPI00161FE1DB|nr:MULTISPECIES: hypothetical protein [unclassified Paraburkholderia]MBB5441609.1 hypothetical protein [Paraburkholderia sp. WSM4177]MBB5482004.1 hypothetical protein [Paraburkholderia sp. WSM4180]
MPFESTTVAADASLTRLPKFGWTASDNRESLLLKPFPIGRHGQSAVGMWVDTVSASPLAHRFVSTAAVNPRGYLG